MSISIEESIRSYLFVPGDRPERFDKAWDSAADALIFDLEDAVTPAKKSGAREAIASWLTPARPVWIRVNPESTEWFEEDIELLKRPGVAGAVLPKAESMPVQLEQLTSLSSLRVIPLIETAVGMHRLMELADHQAVCRLAFGSIDYQVDLDIDGDDDALLLARSQIVYASRLARLTKPIDGVTADIKNVAVLASEAGRSKRLGFGAKLCIHPSQVMVVHECLAPDAHERAWASRVLEAVSTACTGAITLDGKMVDLPVIKRAERILAAIPPEISIRKTSATLCG